MADDALLYAHPTDNIVDAVTPTVSVAAATGYPLSNIYDKNPATPYIASSPSAVQFTWDFGTPVNITWAALVMPNIPAATPGVTLQGNSSNSWPGAITLTFTIPTWAEDGFPWNPWVRNTNATAYRYWALFLPYVASVPLKLYEVGLFNTFRQLEFNINWDADLQEKHPLIEHRTDYHVVTEYDRGVRWFELSGEIDATNVGRDQLRAWIRAASGRAKRFFIVPELTDNHAWFVKFQNPDLMQKLTFLDWTKVSVGWEELSRGLRP